MFQQVNKIEYEVISFSENVSDEILANALNEYSKEGWQVINCQSFDDKLELPNYYKRIRFILQRVTQSIRGLIDERSLIK